MIDVQERFTSIIREQAASVENCRKLILGAQLVNVPVTATEQYPEKLGETVEPLRSLLSERIPKLRFSAAEHLVWAASGVGAADRRQIVLVGWETHVCVLQTALDLLSAGFDVFIVVDATSTRHEVDHLTALQRLADAGARLVTTEMVLFEWCEVAGTEQFKEFSRFVTGRERNQS